MRMSAFTSINQRVCFSFHASRTFFTLGYTTRDPTSLVPGMLADLARRKNPLHFVVATRAKRGPNFRSLSPINSQIQEQLSVIAQPFTKKENSYCYPPRIRQCAFYPPNWHMSSDQKRIFL